MQSLLPGWYHGTMSHRWTFSPPDPEAYASHPRRSILLGAEPHGAPGMTHRDMGDWLRSPPTGGLRFLRPLLIAAGLLDGGLPSPLPRAALPFLGGWRYLDCVPVEAGAKVEGDWMGRVVEWSPWLTEEILKDSPARVVVLGGHAGRAFEEVVRPALLPRLPSLLRVHLPHPSAHRPYLSSEEMGNPAERLRPLGEEPWVLGRGGWRRGI